MKKPTLLRTNTLICTLVAVGFLLLAAISYAVNYHAALEHIQQTTSLASESVSFQISNLLSRPLNTATAMTHNVLLRNFLADEANGVTDDHPLLTVLDQLHQYQDTYGYDTVFLVSSATGNYYTPLGLDRTLSLSEEDTDYWYHDLMNSKESFSVTVDEDLSANALHKTLIFINAKCQDTNGDVVGVVGVGLRIESLLSLLNSYYEKFNVSSYLVDQQDIIRLSPEAVGHWGEPLSALQHFSSETLRKIRVCREADVPCTMWDNAYRHQDFVASRYLSYLRYHLVVTQDTTSSIHALNKQLAFASLILLVIIIGILYIITQVVRRFNFQIIELTRSQAESHRTAFERATQQMFESITDMDITHNRPASEATISRFRNLGVTMETSLDTLIRLIAEHQIKEEFRQGYLDLFLPDRVLEAYAGGCTSFQYEFLCLQEFSPAYYWVRITARLVMLDSDHSLHMLTFRQNIDQEKRQETQMQRLAQTDEMTGLLTKSATTRRIQQWLDAHPDKPAAFFILDIDHFKSVNDQFGHAFGDEVILSIANTIHGMFRKDDLIGRIGGDEFVIFLDATDQTWVETRASQLSAALDHVFTTEDGRTWRVTVSIGIALSPAHGTAFAELYRHADRALYHTKAHGRNSWTIYDPDDTQETT